MFWNVTPQHRNQSKRDAAPLPLASLGLSIPPVGAGWGRRERVMPTVDLSPTATPRAARAGGCAYLYIPSPDCQMFFDEELADEWEDEEPTLAQSTPVARKRGLS